MATVLQRHGEFSRSPFVRTAVLASESLYRRVLGSRFDELPEVLRRFHDAPAGARARGVFRVQRGAGRIRNALATVMGFPRAGNELPVELLVVVEGDRERWIREFGGRRMVSIQWAQGSELMERVGAASFSCSLLVEGSRLHYQFQRAWWIGVPLPRFLAPFVESYVEAGDGGWRVLVRIFMPLLGELVCYQGWIESE
jgi:hypothetical protein